MIRIFLLRWCVLENFVIMELIINWFIVVSVSSSLYCVVVIFKFFVVNKIK